MKKTLVALLLFAIASIAQAQSNTEKAITGRILLEDGQPASGAKIGASPVGARGGWHSANCDEAGNFKLALSTPGSYKLEVTAPGFVLDSHSASDNVYRAGENVTLRLVKGSVITGRVVDVVGEPLVGIGVSLYRVRDAEGNRLRGTDAGVVDAQTDDRGIYRAYGLQPGAYLIGAEVSDGGNQSGRDVPTWYPSATRDTAIEVTVNSGDEATNIDIRHRGDTGRAISGTVSSEAASVQADDFVSITLLNAATKEPIARSGVYESGRSNELRAFVLYGLSDGDYELFAVAYGEDGAAASAPRHVTIRGADVTGIELKLVKFGAISGRVLIEPTALNNAAAKCGGKTRSAVEEVLLRARAEGRNPRSLNALTVEHDRRINRVAPDAKGEFTIRSLEADSYRLETDLPGENWYVRSITQPMTPSAGGAAKRTDIARLPINLKSGEKLNGIEIAIAEGAAGLKGRVSSAKENQKLPLSLRVYILPAEPTATDNVLRYRETMAGQDRSFEFKHLAPGKYFLLARSVSENEANSATLRPAAFDPVQRTQLRREAEAAKNEITLEPCSRVKDHSLRF